MIDVDVERMKLVAVMRDGAEHVAMIEDPAGVGHSVRRGHYVGKPRPAPTPPPGVTEMTLNWRVDEVREDAVVLGWYDPANRHAPPIVKILRLHTPAR